jgi:hypothetical protein
MTYTCLHAYTADSRESYPANVSINKDDRDGENWLTVRTRGCGGSLVGMIVLTDEQLRKLARDVLSALGE